MKLGQFRTPLVLIALVATTVVALRAADDKSKGKEGDQPGVIKFSTAPAAVQKLFKEETKNAKIELLGEGKSADGKAFYKAIVPIGASDYEMAVSEDGQLLEKMLNPIRSEVKLEECPPVVQKALKDDSKGAAKVEAIERVTAGKRSDFMMTVLIQKIRYQVIFTEDGTLMSKVMDDSGNEESLPSPEVQKVSEKPEKSGKKTR